MSDGPLTLAVFAKFYQERIAPEFARVVERAGGAHAGIDGPVTSTAAVG